MTHETDTSDPPGSFGMREIIGIILRWRYWLLGGLVTGAVLGIVGAVFLKPVYRATASLLIESQDLPTTVVASPLTDLAEERIAKIRQQVLSRGNLQALIARNGLYAKERGSLPADAVMAMLRDAISVDLVSAAAGNQSRRGTDATIAFDLSYTNSDAAATLRVADQLTDMFVSEDKRLRSEQMSGAATFLARRADEIRDRLVAMEAKRRGIEARYAGALPDQVATSAQSTSSLRAEISRMDAESQGIMQQNGLLAARSQEVAPSAPSAAQTELVRAQAQLARAVATYSDSHPDVVLARAAVAAAQGAVSREPGGRNAAAPLMAEVAAGRSRIAMLAQRRASLVAAVAQSDRMVAMSPQASYELNNLEREYDNLKQQYQGIREKQLDAQVAVNLQNEGKGERFSVVDRPTFPLTSIGMKRVRLVVMGAGAGLALAIGFVLMFELLVMPVNGPGALVRLTGSEPLVAITVLRTGPAADATRWWHRWSGWRPLAGRTA